MASRGMGGRGGKPLYASMPGQIPLQPAVAAPKLPYAVEHDSGQANPKKATDMMLQERRSLNHDQSCVDPAQVNAQAYHAQQVRQSSSHSKAVAESEREVSPRVRESGMPRDVKRALACYAMAGDAKQLGDLCLNLSPL